MDREKLEQIKQTLSDAQQWHRGERQTLNFLWVHRQAWAKQERQLQAAIANVEDLLGKQG